MVDFSTIRGYPLSETSPGTKPKKKITQILHNIILSQDLAWMKRRWNKGILWTISTRPQVLRSFTPGVRWVNVISLTREIQ